MIVKHEELQSLDANGRPCEVCGNQMRGHKWVDMDRAGFVTDCSEIQDGKPE